MEYLGIDPWDLSAMATFPTRTILKVVGYTIALAYCLHNALPFSAYGELLFLLIPSFCFGCYNLLLFSTYGYHNMDPGITILCCSTHYLSWSN